MVLTVLFVVHFVLIVVLFVLVVSEVKMCV